MSNKNKPARFISNLEFQDMTNPKVEDDTLFHKALTAILTTLTVVMVVWLWNHIPSNFWDIHHPF